MNWLAAALTSGIAAFCATNIDDIIILILFFAQVNATFRKRHIIVGQYLGFTALLLASLPGFFGRLAVSPEWIGLLGFIPIGIGILQLIRGAETEPEVQDVTHAPDKSMSKTRLQSFFASLISPQTYGVAAVTIANGGDNISIYVPLFASHDLAGLCVILGVFYVLVGVWCYVGYLLSSHQAIALLITRYGHAIVPFVMIGLGLFILFDNGSWKLLLMN